MKIANQARRFSRKALGVYLILGLSIPGVASSSASITQSILTFIGPGLRSKQETPIPSGSQAIPSTKKKRYISVAAD
jgi:hypothetical protein